MYKKQKNGKVHPDSLIIHWLSNSYCMSKNKSKENVRDSIHDWVSVGWTIRMQMSKTFNLAFDWIYFLT